MKRNIILMVLSVIVGSVAFGELTEKGEFPEGVMNNKELSDATYKHNDRIEAVEGIAARNRLRVTELEKNQQDLSEVKERSVSNESRIGSLEKNKLDISEIEKRSKKNELNVGSNSKKIVTTNDKLNTHMNKYEETLDRLKKKNIEEDIHLVENDHKIEVDGKNIAEHDKRLNKDEATIATHTKKIEADEKNIAEHDKRLNKDEATIATHTKKIEADEKNIAEHDKRLNKDEATIATHTKKIEADEESIDKHENAIFKTIGGTYTKKSQPIKVNKIDDNTDRIVKLENRKVDTSGIDANKAKIDTNATKINNNMNTIAENSNEIHKNYERISSLDSKIDNIEGDMNKGFAMSAAMASVDFQTVKVGNVGLGIGVGNYKDSQAVSIGVGLRPSENTTVNVKGAMSTGTTDESMIGAGATYQFSIFGS